MSRLAVAVLALAVGAGALVAASFVMVRLDESSREDARTVFLAGCLVAALSFLLALLHAALSL